MCVCVFLYHIAQSSEADLSGCVREDGGIFILCSTVLWLVGISCYEQKVSVICTPRNLTLTLSTAVSLMRSGV